MKMTGEYLAETADAFASAGFDVQLEHDDDVEGDVVHFRRTRTTLRRGPREHIEVEHLTYPDGRVTWWFALVEWHGLRAQSFPMDSWKHRPDRVEFKFMASKETGLGLAFTVHFDGLDD